MYGVQVVDVGRHRDAVAPVQGDVVGDVRAGQRGVPDVRKHRLEGVAELVEHGLDVVEAEQRRLARRRPGEIGHVEGHRPGAEQAGLIHEGVLPCPAALAGPREIVGIPERERTAVRVVDLEHPHVGMIGGDVLPLLEAQPVQ